MARRQRRTRRGITTDTLSEEQFMELWVGPGDTSAFPDEWTKRATWRAVRDDMVGDSEGQRPAGWWLYESPEPRDCGEPQHRQLARLGELTEYERNVLRKWAAVHPVYELTTEGEVAGYAARAESQRWPVEMWANKAKQHGWPAELWRPVADRLRAFADTPPPHAGKGR